jgi:hypothetical protein
MQQIVISGFERFRLLKANLLSEQSIVYLEKEVLWSLIGCACGATLSYGTGWVM